MLSVKDLRRFQFVLVLFLFGAFAKASPIETHLFSPKNVIERLDGATNADAARKAFYTKSGKGVVVLEPLIRALSSAQVFSSSDWIGMQALLASAARIDPGEEDDASNMFVYSCKGGWIDMGHVILSALAYKTFEHAMRGNYILKEKSKKYLKPAEAQLYADVVKSRRETLREIKKLKSFNTPRLRQLLGRALEIRVRSLAGLTGVKLSDDQIKAKVEAEMDWTLSEFAKEPTDNESLRLAYERFWAGYFALQAGYAVEYHQNSEKLKNKSDGYATSAWTIEDLPSDSYGVKLGSRLTGEKILLSSAMKQIKNEISQMMLEFAAVNLDNKTAAAGCAATAKEILVSDTRYYIKTAASTKVSHQIKDSFDSKSPYNYFIRPKKTVSHRCLCDENNNPINRDLSEIKDSSPLSDENPERSH